MSVRHHDHHFVRKAHRNLGPWVAFLLLAATTAVALRMAYVANRQAIDTSEKVEAAGPPCIDARPRVPGVQPSRGCGRIFALLADYCGDHPKFCASSQRKAVQRVQTQATKKVIGPVALLDPGGGGSSPGSPNTPNSPNTPPSNPPDGGGNGGGQENPPPQGQPPSQPSNPAPDQQPGSQNPDKPLVDVPTLLEETKPACDVVQSPLGPVIQICP